MTIQDMIRQAALANSLDPALALAVAQRESGFNPNAAGAAGEVGVFQLTAAAAQDVGVNRYDLGGNILGGVLYLKRMLALSGGDEWLAIAAYNAGWSNASRGVIPISTQNYVAGVLASRAYYGGQPDVVARIPAPYIPYQVPQETAGGNWADYYEEIPYLPETTAPATAWGPVTILALAAAGVVGLVVLTR